jgi:hypothetical protein
MSGCTVIRDRQGEWVVTNERGSTIARGFDNFAAAEEWIGGAEKLSADQWAFSKKTPRRPKQLKLPLRSYGQKGQRVMGRPEPHRKHSQEKAATWQDWDDRIDDLEALQGGEGMTDMKRETALPC